MNKPVCHHQPFMFRFGMPVKAQVFLDTTQVDSSCQCSVAILHVVHAADTYWIKKLVRRGNSQGMVMAMRSRLGLLVASMYLLAMPLFWSCQAGQLLVEV